MKKICFLILTVGLGFFESAARAKEPPKAFPCQLNIAYARSDIAFLVAPDAEGARIALSDSYLKGSYNYRSYNFEKLSSVSLCRFDLDQDSGKPIGDRAIAVLRRGPEGFKIYYITSKTLRDLHELITPL